MSRQASFNPDVDRTVRSIIDAVRQNGDDAVRSFTKEFDNAVVSKLKVSPPQLASAFETLSADFKSILEEAAHNIRQFHEKQLPDSWFMDDGAGVMLGQRVVPIQRVGVYVPGGKAFYPSSLLMNVIPAQVAGVSEIHIVSPPGSNGLPSTLVMGAAHLLGVKNVYAVGGAQAVAALAFGTESIPGVDKIVGPGNVYVATAKKQVFGPVDIDSVAGPSEIVVLADDTAQSKYVAADLLSQAEHDEDASAILVTPSRQLAESVCRDLETMVPALSRKAIMTQSLGTYGACVVSDTLSQAIEVVNELAPEHLEIMTADPWHDMTHIVHAGAIFLGPYSSEPVGDYFAGPNHVLPTGGTARYASALSVDDFIRKQSIIRYTREKLKQTGPKIIDFANAEELTAHAHAIAVRLEDEDQ